MVNYKKHIYKKLEIYFDCMNFVKLENIKLVNKVKEIYFINKKKRRG